MCLEMMEAKMTGNRGSRLP